MALPFAASAGPGPKTVALVIDEATEATAQAGLPPGPPRLSEEVATVLTRALMSGGWTVIVPPPSPPIVRALDARDLGRRANAAYVVFGRVRFTTHPGFTPEDSIESVTFPVTGVYELTVVNTIEGTVLGASTGTLAMARPGESAGEAMARMNVSYERTVHGIVSRQRTAELTAPILKALDAPASAPAPAPKGAK